MTNTYKIDYTNPLIELVSIEFAELGNSINPQDKLKYDKYCVMAKYFDDNGVEISKHSSKTLAEMCNYTSPNFNEKLTETDFLKFRSEPLIKGWNEVRLNELLEISLATITSELQKGKFQDTQQQQAFIQIVKTLEEKKATDRVKYIRSYIPPLLGPELDDNIGE